MALDRGCLTIDQQPASMTKPQPQHPAVAATAANLRGFAIPPLQPGDKITDYKSLFKVAVTGLLMQQDGEKLAVGLFPRYINRRTVERELVQETVKLDNLDDAFDFLCTLDDPVDLYTAMQKLCCRNWIPGQYIDDIF